MNNRLLKSIVLAVLGIALAVVLLQRKTSESVKVPTELPAQEDIEEAAPETVAPTPEQTPEPTPTPTPEPTETPDMHTYNDCLASVYGYTVNRSEESLKNIGMAVAKIDGVKIRSGEVFSFNDTLGETTEANDFVRAEVYASYPEDEVYQVGGGVNLVASTLYCASLYGVLDPEERCQHYYWIAADNYLRWGCDAYVCNDGENDTYDMKISNPFPDPVMIKAWLDTAEEKVHVELYGTNPDGLKGVPRHSLTSYYLVAAPYVCDRFTNHMYRDVSDNSGYVRTDDLNQFDYGVDGDVYYHRHPADYVW